MKIITHSHRRGHVAFGPTGEGALRFVGMLVGTAESPETDVFSIAAHWQGFLRQHGWKERASPLQTSVLVRDQFFTLKRACVSLSLAHGDQVGHVLLAFQGLYKNGEIDVGILCVHGGETLARVRVDLTWLRRVLTVPIWVIALQAE